MLNAVCVDFPKLSRETRIFLGKAMQLFMDANAEHLPSQLGVVKTEISGVAQ